MFTIYGYARVSSKKQLHGNSIEEQTTTLTANGAITITTEQYTGKTTSRPKLQKLLDSLQPGDTLMVTKLDRLARNVSEGIELIRALFKKDVKVHVLNIGLLENTSMGNFFITTLLAVAELERNMIIERTQAGKEVARTKAGFREGRPPLPCEKIQLAISLLDSYTYREVEAMTGISKATLVRYRRKTKL
ncbi:recombinase family protein [uncultured Phascolarctobacterium sp.]|uniref:recombinase family protein n=1 Tax=uncultured Phascolarctobacterium sp. TaxID=512296 RepID=UPI00345C2C2B